jgi:hypothetical protein
MTALTPMRPLWRSDRARCHPRSSPGGTVEVVTTVASGGEFTSCRYEEVGSDCYAVPGLDVDVIAPLERLGFRYQGLGFRGVDAEGFPATRRREVAD